MNHIKINRADNVAVAIEELHENDRIIIENEEITIKENIKAGHKILLEDCKTGMNIIKYGYPIGKLNTNKVKGECVDDRHIKTNLEGLLEYTYSPVDTTLNIKKEGRTFYGYRRKNGEVGIRNERGVVPTVGWVNGVQRWKQLWGGKNNIFSS